MKIRNIDLAGPESLEMLQVVPAQYAFVVHTANPISKQKGETFGEVVMGMGEALVGNYPGRALSFSSQPGQQVLPLFLVTWHNRISSHDRTNSLTFGSIALGLQNVFAIMLLCD